MALEHARVGELTIKLLSPTGILSTLVSVPGYEEIVDGAPERIGSMAALRATSPIVFDPLQPGAVSAENMGFGLLEDEAVCTGDGRCAFVPNAGSAEGAGFADFLGKRAGGTWNVCVGDVSPGNIGRIESLELSYGTL